MNWIIIAHIIIKRKLDINSNEKPNKKKQKNNYFTARRCRRWLEAFYQKDILTLSGSQPIFLLPSLSTVSQSYINSCISKAEEEEK